MWTVSRPGTVPHPATEFPDPSSLSSSPLSLSSSSYRRSYARLYEATVCESISRDDVYGQHFLQSPQDIVGRYVQLQVLNETQHLQSLFDVTCGKATLSYKSYNAQQDIWFFLPQGPFPNSQDMSQSYIFGYSPKNVIQKQQQTRTTMTTARTTRVTTKTRMIIRMIHGINNMNYGNDNIWQCLLYIII